MAASNAASRPLSRLAFVALGANWRAWLGDALGIGADEAAALIAGEAAPSEAQMTRLAALGQAATRANLGELLAAIALGLAEDGVPEVVIAAHLDALAKSFGTTPRE